MEWGFAPTPFLTQSSLYIIRSRGIDVLQY
jgi:hypothetical protein